MTDPDDLTTAEAVELVSVNQGRMQDLLTDVRTGDKARAQLLAWAEVVDSAAQLWAALPQASDVATQSMLNRLQVMSNSLHDATTGAWWTSTRPDEQLMTVADTYARAADLLQGIRVNEEDATRIRASVAASLHLGTHVIGDTASRYAAGAAALSRAGASRHRRPNAQLVADAAARMRGMEQIAGAAVGGLYALRRPDTGADTDEALASTLARWAIQSHRSLVTRPSTMTMMLIAQTEAEIGRMAAAVLRSRAAMRDTDGMDLEQRALTPIAGSVIGWRDVASEWRSMLVGDARLHVDPLLAAASQEVRALVVELTAGVPGQADPDFALAFRIDVPQTCSTVQDALAHTADIARASRDLTLTSKVPFRGPPRQLTDRAAELAGDEVAWVDLRALNRGKPVPLPRPVVEHLAAAYSGIADWADRALSGSVSLHTPTRPRAHNKERAPASTRKHRQPTTPSRPSTATLIP